MGEMETIWFNSIRVAAAVAAAIVAAPVMVTLSFMTSKKQRS